MFWTKIKDEKYNKFILKNYVKFLSIFAPIILILFVYISILIKNEVLGIVAWIIFATFFTVSQLRFGFYLLQNKINGKKIIYEGGWGAFLSKRDYIVYLEK